MGGDSFSRMRATFSRIFSVLVLLQGCTDDSGAGETGDASADISPDDGSEQSSPRARDAGETHDADAAPNGTLDGTTTPPAHDHDSMSEHDASVHQDDALADGGPTNAGEDDSPVTNLDASSFPVHDDSVDDATWIDAAFGDDADDGTACPSCSALLGGQTTDFGGGVSACWNDPRAVEATTQVNGVDAAQLAEQLAAQTAHDFVWQPEIYGAGTLAKGFSERTAIALDIDPEPKNVTRVRSFYYEQDEQDALDGAEPGCGEFLEFTLTVAFELADGSLAGELDVVMRSAGGALVGSGRADLRRLQGQLRLAPGSAAEYSGQLIVMLASYDGQLRGSLVPAIVVPNPDVLDENGSPTLEAFRAVRGSWPDDGCDAYSYPIASNDAAQRWQTLRESRDDNNPVPATWQSDSTKTQLDIELGELNGVVCESLEFDDTGTASPTATRYATYPVQSRIHSSDGRIQYDGPLSVVSRIESTEALMQLGHLVPASRPPAAPFGAVDTLAVGAESAIAAQLSGNFEQGQIEFQTWHFTRLSDACLPLLFGSARSLMETCEPASSQTTRLSWDTLNPSEESPPDDKP